MAKKKQKKNVKNLKLSNILTYASCLLGLIATCMIFLPAINGEMKPLFGDVVKESFTGLQVAFGYTKVTGDKIQIVTETLNANVFAIIVFLLPIALTFVALIFKNVKIANLIVTLLFVACGICLFTLAGGFAKNIVEDVAWVYTNYVWTLGVGPILAGICSCLAGVSLAGKFIVK